MVEEVGGRYGEEDFRMLIIRGRKIRVEVRRLKIEMLM